MGGSGPGDGEGDHGEPAVKYPRLGAGPDVFSKPRPAWWRFAHRYLWRIPRLVGYANQLYAWHYGFWAPCMMDYLTRTSLHELSSDTYAEWGVADSAFGGRNP